MSEFKLPHVEDLTTNSKLPGQLTENFKAIEQALSDETADRKKGDDTEKSARQAADDDLEKRISKLEQTSATHEEVTQVSQEWHDRASHIARGTDIPTTRAVVLHILAEIGQVDLSKLPELDDDVVTKKEFDELIGTLNQNRDNVSAADPDLYSWLENYAGGV